ncbi:MAG: hypothetical protein WC108_02875 [Bacteroidales bacterium]|jgi:hypothetical protein|nr:hypothetical protein [Candidatus ainarchaeum sp.]MDD3086227.1 hypothetical protein [Candidatus ainarchaeum sp.]MDD4128833.1 hypothetical protein [Candidatus ainarchaeum sp.]MDD4468165.1 hypothetical protein [Candidatus ainarchaeum sp.]
MDFKLDYGPWEQIFTGTTYGHEVEIVSNPENFYIVIVYDVSEGRRRGAVIEGYKAFYAKGQVESFIQTLPKQCLGIEKNMGEKTGKIFFLSFEPFYVDFKQEDYSRRIDNEIKKIEENSSMMMDLARASSVELKELSTVQKNDYSSILGDPFIVKLLASGSKGPTLSKIDLTLNNTIDEEKIPLIQLGLSKTREIIKEPTSVLMRTQLNGVKNSLNYAAYIISENLLLDNTPLIIFDDDNYFNQLNVATQNRTELKDELVDFEPMAFPIKEYHPKQNIKVSLKDTDFISILQLIGVKDNEFEKNLSLFAFTAQVNSIEELLQKINDSKELNGYEKLRSERIVNIIKMNLGEIFGQSTSSEELIRAIPGRLGRGIIINTKNLLIEEKIIFTQTLLRQLTKFASEKNQTKCGIVIPKIDYLLEFNKERTLTTITRTMNRGLGLIIGSEKELPLELNSLLSTKMSIITGKDIAVMIKGKKTYRINLRPSLSGQLKI